MVTQVTKRQEGAKDLFGLEFLSFFPGRGWGGGGIYFGSENNGVEFCLYFGFGMTS